MKPAHTGWDLPHPLMVGQDFGHLAVGYRASWLKQSQHESAPSRPWTGQLVPEASLTRNALLSP